MHTVNTHQANINKAKKGMLLLAMLLGLFAFSTPAGATQPCNPLSRSEAFFTYNASVKSSLSYKRAVYTLYNRNTCFLFDSGSFTYALSAYNNRINTRYQQLQRLKMQHKRPPIYLYIVHYSPQFPALVRA